MPPIKVLSCQQRKPLTPSLLNHPHQLYLNEDHPFLTVRGCGLLSLNPIGAYRCFKGHQMIAESITETTLVLEDDAIPQPRWKEIVESAQEVLERHEYDVVSLHVRGEMNPAFIRASEKNKCWVYVNHLNDVQQTPKKDPWNGTWALGSLAYLISPSAAKKLAHLQWDGMPIDLVLHNKFNFAYISKPMSFQHNVGPSVVESI